MATRPPARLDGLRGAPPVTLDAEAVAGDALGSEGLAELLEEAGFVTASERTYVGAGAAIRRVVVRVVRFSSPAGAERYLSWLRSHASEVIGDATAVPWDVGSAFVHEPGGCCPKEQPSLLAAWRLGPEVVRVIAAGPGADGPEGRALLRELRSLLAPGP
ncbi:MAG: hypothetical protein KatS3mg014_1491 [Actinomycetota bacterium]|nr:MAG: hypothetical protein KatS3mg014_1491 [Actinomycetota bacterium]